MDGPRSHPGATTNETPTNDTTPANGTLPNGTGLRVSRRNVVLGVSVVGAAGLVSACGGSSGTTASSSGSSSTSAPSASSSGGNSGGSGGSGGSEKLASKADVPVGGGSINQDAKVVVTQPTSGTFKAFTAVCTHMNCLVAQVSKNVITCPCHGSQYSATDGSVQSGPAPSPLAPVAIKVDGNEIVKA